VGYAIKTWKPSANNDQGQIQSASRRVRQLFTRVEGPHPLSPGSGGSFCEPGTCCPLLVIGRDILNRQADEGWRTKIIDRLSDDLTKAFPDVRGFRARNLKYMRAFAEAYPDKEFVQQVVAQLPWGHQVRILDTLKDAKERDIRQAIQNGWSRNVLVHQIEGKLFHRQGHALTNFDRTLPEPQSELAQQLSFEGFSIVRKQTDNRTLPMSYCEPSGAARPAIHTRRRRAAQRVQCHSQSDPATNAYLTGKAWYGAVWCGR